MGLLLKCTRQMSFKGWYRAATEVEAQPCPQMMACQTEEQIALYTRRTPPREPLPININPAPIPDGVPTDSEVRDAVGELTNGRSGGASKMRAEHMKEWLQGIQRKEDPKTAIGNQGAGDALRCGLGNKHNPPATRVDNCCPNTQRWRRLSRDRIARADLEDLQTSSG